MKNLHYVIALLGLLAHPTVAHAQDQAVISTARELAKQAFQAYDEGRYDEAAEKSLRAYQVVRVPTLAVNRARALVKLGKLLAASELYLEATRLPRAPSWQSVQDDAVSNAERERAELLPRIPRVKIAINGADMARVAISIDGRSIPSALLNTEQMVDPGKRVVVGSFGQQEVQQVVMLKEGEQQPVTLRFAASAHAAVMAETSSRGSPKFTSTERNKPSKILPILGWTGVGIGSAGLIFGAFEGFSAKSKRNTLIDTGLCTLDGEHCDGSKLGEVNAYKSARTMSMVGLYAGGVLAAVGVTLLVWPAKKESQSTVGITLGPSFVGLRGELQ